MSKDTEVDTTPELVGEADVEASEKTTEISHNDLANLFDQEGKDVVEDVEEQVDDDSDIVKVEEPAVEPELESDQEDSSLKEDKSDKKAEDKAEGDDEEPTWFRKRIDKITAQKKDAEERIATLEAKLSEISFKEEPAYTVDKITKVEQLNELEKQAIDAEDQVDDLLEEEPKYDDEGNAYWQVGDMKKSRQELIQIRKNARQAYRAIPAKREFLTKKAVTDANVEKLPFFSDKEHPYYTITQKTLDSAVYKKLENEIPDAKAAIALMIFGMIARDSETKTTEKKSEVKKPANTVIKSTSNSKAVTDTGTTKPSTSREDQIRKSKKHMLSMGNISRDQAVELFS